MFASIESAKASAPSRGLKLVAGFALLSATVAVVGLTTGEHRFAAHEWGTFTSVQGADGVLMDWHPLRTAELPKFVYDWAKPGFNRAGGTLALGKRAMTSLQRMETPVIYFYSQDELSVDVSVRFPKGLITEWYPQARQVGPSTVPVRPTIAKLDTVSHKVGVPQRFTFASLFSSASAKDSRIHWANVKVLPTQQHADAASLVPTEKSGSHYFAARETDAELLRVSTPGQTNGPEYEKFLFYRGVGNFSTPLCVKMQADETLTLANLGSAPLTHLFLLEVRDGQGRFLKVDRLAATGSHEVQLRGVMEPLTQLTRKLAAEMTSALTAEGLFQREATAMVNTWKDSWFAEEGLRVLYVLPRAWTDDTLPITLRPAPAELVRVMVGRAEIITPFVQRELSNALTQAKAGDGRARENVVAEFKKLGRFAEPALRLAIRNSSADVNQTAWALLQSAAKDANESRPL